MFWDIDHHTDRNDMIWYLNWVYWIVLIIFIIIAIWIWNPKLDDHTSDIRTNIKICEKRHPNDIKAQTECEDKLNHECKRKKIDKHLEDNEVAIFIFRFAWFLFIYIIFLLFLSIMCPIPAAMVIALIPSLSLTFAIYEGDKSRTTTKL